METPRSTQSKIWHIVTERLHGVVIEHPFGHHTLAAMEEESRQLRSLIYDVDQVRVEKRAQVERA